MLPTTWAINLRYHQRSRSKFFIKHRVWGGPEILIARSNKLTWESHAVLLPPLSQRVPDFKVISKVGEGDCFLEGWPRESCPAIVEFDEFDMVRWWKIRNQSAVDDSVLAGLPKRLQFVSWTATPTNRRGIQYAREQIKLAFPAHSRLSSRKVKAWLGNIVFHHPLLCWVQRIATFETHSSPCPSPWPRDASTWCRQLKIAHVKLKSSKLKPQVVLV